MSTSNEETLARLLLSLFSADELRRYLRYGPQGDAIERDMPGVTASAAAVAEEAVEALVKRGLVDSAFFDRLLSERSGRSADIEKVRAHFAARTAIGPVTPNNEPRSESTKLDASIAIIVALQEELDVLRTTFAAAGVHWRKPSRDPDGGFDLPFEGPGGGGVVRLLGQMGPEAAGRVADRVIRRWRPRLVVNIGIAGSLGSLRLGDVLVARQIDAYLATGRVSDGPSGPKFERRGEVFRADHVAVEEAVHLRNAYRDRFDAWRRAGTEQLEREVLSESRARLLAENALRKHPEYRVGHLASGPLVVSSTQFATWLLGRDEKLEAVEMEAAGVAAAAWERAGPTPSLVVRGISDLSDGNKYSTDAVGHGALRRLAMANASRLLLELLAALRDREGEVPYSAAHRPSAVVEPYPARTRHQARETSVSIGMTTATQATPEGAPRTLASRALTDEGIGRGSSVPIGESPAPTLERTTNRTARVFISYAHEDERHRVELEKHLKILQRQGVISIWHDRRIEAGEEWEGAIDRNLNEAEIILLLVSPDFLASDYCWGVETTLAMERHAAGTARVIPVFVRACDWQGAPFSRLQGIPDPSRPVAAWASPDEAWTAVGKEIRSVAVYRPPEMRRSSPVGVLSPPRSSVEPGTPVSEIFALGKEPKVTFVEPSQLSHIRTLLRSMGTGLVVQGPSGVGKTTATRRALGEAASQHPIRWLYGQRTQDLHTLDEMLDVGFQGHLVVDDFHYLSEKRCGRVADAMKVLASDNSDAAKITVIGINPIGLSLLHDHPDLAGRYVQVSMTRQPDELVDELVTLGERAANVRFLRRLDYVKAARGSFFTAQQICFQACLRGGREHSEPENKAIDISVSDVVARVISILEGKYLPRLVSFAAWDSDRAPRGACLALLHLLAHDPEDMVLIEQARARFPAFRQTFEWLTSTGFVEAFRDINKLDRVIFYNPVAKVLSAEDPQLAFYLQNLDWPTFARKTGHTNVRFDPARGLVFD